jgi:hypothetical protein
VDASGQPVNASEIFDPATPRPIGNSFVRTPFSNNTISISQQRSIFDNSFIFALTIRDTEIVDQKRYRFRANYTWVIQPNVLFNSGS